MYVDATAVSNQREWILDRSDEITAIIKIVRADLGDAFDTTVTPPEQPQVEAEIAAVFEEPARAMNVAAYVGLLRNLDCIEDYPGFIVDDVLGRELAGTIAGGQPLRLLAEATFHYGDVVIDDSDTAAGIDDLEVAIAAGIQTRLPGWQWQERAAPIE